jgi:hypothetical protein
MGRELSATNLVLSMLRALLFQGGVFLEVFPSCRLKPQI